MPFAVMIIVIVGMSLGVGAIAIVTEHFQKMAKIRAQVPARGSQPVLEAIEAIRKEVADLRDTSTKYDMSFDAALQRMESRLTHVEQRVNRFENESLPQEISAGR